jgi:MFS family permease
MNGRKHDGACCRDRDATRVVEGTDPRAMARVDRSLARLGPGCLRFHDFPPDHGAHRHDFNVPLVEVTAVFTITLWMRLVGATASGWLADRVGRKLPLMISIAWYSLANLLAGLAPSFWLLFLFRAVLGIGMGAEWPAGAALAMEQWPQRSRGLMGSVLQSSWGLGALLSSAAYGLLYNYIGWRGLLMLGVLPALLLVYIRVSMSKSSGLGREPPHPAYPETRGAAAAS